MNRFESVTAEAMALPSESRAELAEMLIQSLDELEGDEVRSAWLAEIRRRDQEIRDGLAVTRPAEQVLREARDRLRCSK